MVSGSSYPTGFKLFCNTRVGDNSQVSSFTHLGSIISKGGVSSENVKSRIVKAQGVFSYLKKVQKNRKISQEIKSRILEATVMTVVKYGSEAWTLQKADKDLLHVF